MSGFCPEGCPDGEAGPCVVGHPCTLHPDLDAVRAQAKAEALSPFVDLAMEHMNCSGCPTPWWLKQALDRAIEGQHAPTTGEPT